MVAQGGPPACRDASAGLVAALGRMAWVWQAHPAEGMVGQERKSLMV